MRQCRPDVAGSLMTMSLSGARPTAALCPGMPTTRLANGPVSKVIFAGASALTGCCCTVWSVSVSLVEAAGCHAGMIGVASVPPASDDWAPLAGSPGAVPAGQAIMVAAIGLAPPAGAEGAGAAG